MYESVTVLLSTGCHKNFYCKTFFKVLMHLFYRHNTVCNYHLLHDLATHMFFEHYNVKCLLNFYFYYNINKAIVDQFYNTISFNRHVNIEFKIFRIKVSYVEESTKTKVLPCLTILDFFY